jgi:hypothetical protein
MRRWFEAGASTCAGRGWMFRTLSAEATKNHFTVIPAKAGIHFDFAVAVAVAVRSFEQEQEQNGFRLSPE